MGWRCRLIRDDYGSRGADLAVYQSKRSKSTIFREQSTSRPEHNRGYRQEILVNEMMREQRSNKLTAPKNPKITTQLLLESGHGPHGVALQEG